MMIPLYKILLNLKAHPIVVAIHTCTHAHTHAYTIDVAYCSFPDVYANSAYKPVALMIQVYSCPFKLVAILHFYLIMRLTVMYVTNGPW